MSVFSPFQGFGLPGFGEGTPGAATGSVSRAPATIHDGLYATSGSMPTAEFGPMFWTRNGTALPQVGDALLLVWPVYGDPWAMWWPG
jgi:hypothetical protein